MAGDAVIGALRVVLGLDTADFDKGLKSSQSGAASWAREMTKIAGGIGLERMLESFVASAVNSIKHGVMLGDELNKMSQKAGVTVEEFGRLKYSAELSDVSVETLGKSLGKLSKALVEAGTDAASKAGRAFKEMGIEVQNQDGTVRNQSEVLSDIAEKFKGYKDSAEKTALAIAIFGKAGAEMIPLLNTGREGLKETADEAEKFGLVLDKQTTMAAEAFMDNLKKLDAVKQGLFTTIARDLLPSLEHLSAEFLETKKNSDFAATASEFVKSAIMVLTQEVALFTVQLQNARREFAALADFVSNVGDIDDLRASWNRWNLVLEENGERLTEVKNRLATVADAFNVESFVSRFATATSAISLMTKEHKRLQEEQAKTTAPKVGDTEATTNALLKFIDAQAKSTAGRLAEADAIGKSVGLQAQLKIAYEADAIAKTNNIVITEALRAKITAAGDAAAMAAMKVAGANATVAAMNPAEQFAMQMDQLRQLYDAGVISLETYGRRQQQIAEQAGATWDLAGASIAGSFSKIAGAFGKEGSAMAKAAKVFGIIQGTISMYTGAAKALELPFPANLAAMAAVLAQGASLVASIKGQNVPTGAMMGGAFQVPGGLGGGDKVFTPMMLEPGELVEVTSNRADGYKSGGRNGSQSGGTTMVYLDAALRPLAEALFPHFNAAMRDGHELKLATI